MTMNSDHYVPINCEFHDVLESLATTRRPAQIKFRGVDGDVEQRDATIIDVYARDGIEYLAISTGEILRLDQLLEVDGEILARYQAAADSDTAEPSR